MTRIAIVGMGHVGLVTGIAFATWGHEVLGADVDGKAIKRFRAGVATFYEPALEETLGEALHTGQLTFTTDIEGAARSAEAIFLCVGTPSRKDGSIDLSFLRQASQASGRGMRAAEDYQVIVVKSTVVPGTTEDIVRPTVETSSGKKAGEEFGLAVNPEFLREGSAVEDALHLDRLVIGALDDRSRLAVERIYTEVTCPRLSLDLRTAEMVKYATNAFLATKVSFVNELANLCDAFGGIDVDRVVEAMGLDPRINPRFMKPGLGFGGSCFPKDLRAIIAGARTRGYEAKVLRSVLDLNDEQPLRAVALSEKAVGTLKGKRVAILGLSFKGGSDDVRESRAIPLAQALLKRGAHVAGYDPEANALFHAVMPEVEVTKDVASALAHADVCIVHNDWPRWRELTSRDFSKMRRKIVVDGRRILDRQKLSGVELHVLGG